MTEDAKKIRKALVIRTRALSDIKTNRDKALEEISFLKNKGTEYYRRWNILDKEFENKKSRVHKVFHEATKGLDSLSYCWFCWEKEDNCSRKDGECCLCGDSLCPQCEECEYCGGCKGYCYDY